MAGTLRPVDSGYDGRGEVTSDCVMVELKINPLRALERKLERRFPGLVLATCQGEAGREYRAFCMIHLTEIGPERGEVVVGADDGSRNVAPIVDLSTLRWWLLLRCMGVGAKREYSDHPAALGFIYSLSPPPL